MSKVETQKTRPDPIYTFIHLYKNALELLHHIKQKPKTGLQSNRILAILFHKVDMGNI